VIGAVLAFEVTPVTGCSTTAASGRTASAKPQICSTTLITPETSKKARKSAGKGWRQRHTQTHTLPDYYVDISSQVMMRGNLGKNAKNGRFSHCATRSPESGVRNRLWAFSFAFFCFLLFFVLMVSGNNI
jgi:hypothetical protein